MIRLNLRLFLQHWIQSNDQAIFFLLLWLILPRNIDAYLSFYRYLISSNLYIYIYIYIYILLCCSFFLFLFRSLLRWFPSHLPPPWSRSSNSSISTSFSFLFLLLLSTSYSASVLTFTRSDLSFFSPASDYLRLSRFFFSSLFSTCVSFLVLFSPSLPPPFPFFLFLLPSNFHLFLSLLLPLLISPRLTPLQGVSSWCNG